MLLNNPGEVSGVRGKQQNAGVGREISKIISVKRPTAVELLVLPSKVSLLSLRLELR